MEQPNCEPKHDVLREQINHHIKKLFDIEDTSGLELFFTLQRAAHLSEALESQLSDDLELSGPRWRLMLRLLIEEQIGSMDGITPTSLSHHQRVSKNTISALLRGLEDQGFIQRKLDPGDLRVFRIQLTDAGRELVMKTAPKRIAGLNLLLAGLQAEERGQLINLLDKLRLSLKVQVNHPEPTEETTE